MINELLNNPELIWCSLGNHHLLNWLPDKVYLKLIYHARTGIWPNLDNPRDYTEKLQWEKIHDHNPQYTMMVDKYTVRKYISEKIGDNYLIPLLGVWENAKDIDFAKLPNQFVLKCTHDSGSVRICHDKQSFDINEAVISLNKKLRKGTFWFTREWPYRNVHPRIIAEQYMEDESKEELKDYKVLCFNGVPKLIQVHSGRFNGVHTQDFYDLNWKKTNMTQCGMPMSDKCIAKPETFDEMMHLSALLSNGIPHLRVDWYSINGKLYFGELTFFDASGFERFDDPKVERLLGDWIDLPLR